MTPTIPILDQEQTIYGANQWSTLDRIFKFRIFFELLLPQYDLASFHHYYLYHFDYFLAGPLSHYLNPNFHPYALSDLTTTSPHHYHHLTCSKEQVSRN